MRVHARVHGQCVTLLQFWGSYSCRALVLDWIGRRLRLAAELELDRK